MCDDDKSPRPSLDADFPRLDPDDGFAHLNPETEWDRILYEHGNGWRMTLIANERDLVGRGLLTHEHWKARQAY